MGRLADVEIFVAVVDHGGFTAAARQLGISKSYVSKRVRALEDRVGADLLTRNTRHVAPTALGQQFHARCTAALEVLDEAEQLVARERGTPRGTLRVSVPLTFGVRYITPVLSRFQLTWPELEVDATYTDRKVALVDEGYDLAIRIGNLADSDLLARRLGTSHNLVVAAPAYLDRHGVPESLDELAGHSCLIYTLSAEPTRWTFPTVDGTRQISVHGRVSSDSGDAIAEACREGLGLAMLPDWLVADALAEGTLVHVLQEVPCPSMGIWAVYPRHRHLIPKVSRFVQELADALTPPPWSEEAAP